MTNLLISIPETKEMQKKIAATIQARMRSSRLPGKVLKPIMGRPVLGYLIERVQQSKLLDEIIIATSDNLKDNAIENFAKSIGISVFRGSEEDVLGRIVGAIKEFNIDVHVELHGDNAIPDPKIIDKCVKFYLKNNYDYVSNCLEITYPPGLEVEVYDARILMEIEKSAKEEKYREHVSLYIKSHPEKYRLYNIEAPKNLHYPRIEIELDTQEDFEVIKSIYENLYPENPYFSSLDVINFLKDNPELANSNIKVERRWKQFIHNRGEKKKFGD